MGDKVKLYNVNDGLTGRTGGPYLDEEQARQAETLRARVEDRKPNYDDLQPYAGTMLVPAATLMDQVNVNNTPSEDGKFSLAEAFDDSKIGASAITEAVLDADSDEPTSGSVTSKSDRSEGRR